MATASIILPTENLNQEHRCNKHKEPRYYRLKWEHITVPTKNAKDALSTALPYSFYGGFGRIVIDSLDVAFNCPYYGLHWDEIQGVYLDRELEVLVDAGVTKDCVAAPRRQPDLAIPLGGQKPIVESFRTSGWQFCDENGVLIEDRETVFSRVHHAQVAIDNLAEDKFGKPLVKSVQ
jgi:hypothetical protein